MAVIEPQYTMSGNVEVLLGVGDHVLLVEEDGVQTVGDRLGTLQKMVISHNGKLMASFTHDGQLLVMPTDFSSIIFEYSCEVGFMTLLLIQKTIFSCTMYVMPLTSCYFPSSRATCLVWNGQCVAVLG